jgi:hypothetical protein
VERPAPAPPAEPPGGFLGPLGGAPPGGLDFPPFFPVMAASAADIAANSAFMSCIPAGGCGDAAAPAVSSPVVNAATPYRWAPPCF